MRKLIITALILSSFVSVFGNTKNWKESFEDGLFFFEREDYKEAIYNFGLLYKVDSSNADLNYWIGLSYMNIEGEEVKAIPYFERASKVIAEDYREEYYANEGAPLHTLFYLAKAYRLANDVEKAIEVLEEFKNSPYFPMYNEEIVEQELLTCRRAKILKDKPIDLNVTVLSEPMNSGNNNFKAVISADGNRMVYLSRLKFYDALMYTEFKNGKWMDPVNMSALIPSDGMTHPTFLNADGTELYLVKLLPNGTGDLYLCKYENDMWLRAVPLENINTSGNESHASLSEDGNYLYYCSDRGSKGGLDIFISEKDENGVWKKGKNMGKSINSEKDENTVFEKNGKLFFSSSDHYGMGGYDVFYSVKDEKGKWGEPVNMGYPLNSTSDDLFYLPISDGKMLATKVNERTGRKQIVYLDYSSVLQQNP